MFNDCLEMNPIYHKRAWEVLLNHEEPSLFWIIFGGIIFISRIFGPLSVTIIRFMERRIGIIVVCID